MTLSIAAVLLGRSDGLVCLYVSVCEVLTARHTCGRLVHCARPKREANVRKTSTSQHDGRELNTFNAALYVRRRQFVSTVRLQILLSRLLLPVLPLQVAYFHFTRENI